MKITGRAAISVAFGVGPLLLAAGCGESTGEGARQTLVEIQPSNYVEIAPATTTTTSTTAPATEDGTPGEIAPGEQSYTIKAGDSLSKIASLYEITLEQLVNYNGFPNASQLIVPGDVIKIPPQSVVPESGGATEAAGASDSGSESASEDTADEAATNDGECPTTYVIKAGDTTRIGVAEQFGITFQEMDAANADTPGYANFIVGTEIVIPCPS